MQHSIWASRNLCIAALSIPGTLGGECWLPWAQKCSANGKLFFGAVFFQSFPRTRNRKPHSHSFSIKAEMCQAPFDPPLFSTIKSSKVLISFGPLEIEICYFWILRKFSSCELTVVLEINNSSSVSLRLLHIDTGTNQSGFGPYQGRLVMAL